MLKKYRLFIALSIVLVLSLAMFIGVNSLQLDRINLPTEQPAPEMSIKTSCTNISQKDIWEVGNTADVLTPHLSQSIVVKLDDEEVARDHTLIMFSGSLILEYDKNSKLIGSHGGSIAVCVELPSEKGEYSASVELSSLSGKVHSYNWHFSV